MNETVCMSAILLVPVHQYQRLYYLRGTKSYPTISYVQGFKIVLVPNNQSLATIANVCHFVNGTSFDDFIKSLTIQCVV